jgi:tetratricopeptide (TPR) repeat protein
VPDDIRSLTAALARDPASLAYAELAEALRRRNQRDEALRVALHGLARHANHADGHDVLARIYADLGDLERARLAWSKVLEIVPGHAGALKGVAFVQFRQGDAASAAAALEQALALDPSDDAARRALDNVRRALGPSAAPPRETVPAPAPDAAAVAAAPPEAPPPPEAQAPEPPRGAPPARPRPAVFSGFDRATADILMLDERGLVVAGGLVASNGADVAEVAAAGLAGVSGEATRTGEYLSLGAWRTIVAEAETANLVVAPVGEGALLLVRRDRSMPVGLALRFAERARGTASAWLQGQGG